MRCLLMHRIPPCLETQGSLEMLWVRCTYMESGGVEIRGGAPLISYAFGSAPHVPDALLQELETKCVRLQEQLCGANDDRIFHGVQLTSVHSAQQRYLIWHMDAY